MHVLRVVAKFEHLPIGLSVYICVLCSSYMDNCLPISCERKFYLAWLKGSLRSQSHTGSVKFNSLSTLVFVAPV